MILQSKNLQKFPNIIHGFTTRELGVDYERIADHLKISPSSIFTLKQVHSDRVLVISNLNTQTPKHLGTSNIEADAMISQDTGVVLGVRTADCVPILVYDPNNKAIAAIHAGWKGTLVGITEKTISEMKKCYQSDPSSLIVAMGASICGSCFEVGPEVVNQFRKKFGEKLDIPKGKGNRNFVDNAQACWLVLLDQGVQPKNIEHLPYCTHCRPDLFYSFRKGDETERMLGFIGIVK